MELDDVGVDVDEDVDVECTRLSFGFTDPVGVRLLTDGGPRETGGVTAECLDSNLSNSEQSKQTLASMYQLSSHLPSSYTPGTS